MNSFSKRNDMKFLRNNFSTQNKLGIPMIINQNIDISDTDLISVSNIKANDLKNWNKAVHFFVDDYRFEKYYSYPEKYIKWLNQYAYVLSPDFSLYAEMPVWRQIESVCKNRWYGAYWQSKGIKVIPTVSWGLSNTFDFCFEGIEKNSIVAIGMIGCKTSKARFMNGYNEMLKRLEPETILCYGTPFSEMKGKLIKFNYEKINKYGR